MLKKPSHKTKQNKTQLAVMKQRIGNIPQFKGALALYDWLEEDNNRGRFKGDIYGPVGAEMQVCCLGNFILLFYLFCV